MEAVRDARKFELGIPEVSAMASVGDSVIDEQSHDDLHCYVRTVGDILSLVAPRSPVPLNSLEGVASVRAVVTRSAFRSAIVTVVMSSKSNSIVPAEQANWRGFVDLFDCLFPGFLSFYSTQPGPSFTLEHQVAFEAVELQVQVG